jgi:hypothetical protein
VQGGAGRRGRRDNGLVATDYAVVGDVDPRVGEHLLDVLGLAGVAAYLQPSTDLHPITRTASLPARPTDRLYVDRAHLDTARAHLRRVTGETPPVTAPAADPAAEPDIDTAWQQIVAGLRAEVEPSTAPWPAAEDVARPAGNVTCAAGDVADVEPATAAPDGPDPDDDEGYTPPPPPPLPRISRAAALGVASVAAGLLLFAFPELLPLDGNVVLVLGFGAMVTGFGTLVWRLRPGGDEDNDPDDGARV